MLRYVGRAFMIAGLAGAAVSCDASFGPNLAADPALAYARWRAKGITSYQFEYRVTTAWFGPGPFLRVTVIDGRIADARDALSGAPRSTGSAFSIENIYEWVIASREYGDPVTQQRYSREWVPLRLMVGDFADDRGVLYETQGFEPLD